MNEDVALSLLNTIDDGLNEGRAQIGSVAVKLGEWLDDAVTAGVAAVKRIGRKLTVGLTTRQARLADAIDGVAGRVVQWLNNQIGGSEWTLTGVAVRAGLISPGGSMDDVQWGPDDRAVLDQSPGGTMVLDTRGLVEILAPLLEVLREIRDRIGGEPVVIAGEVPESATVSTTVPTLADDGLVQLAALPVEASVA